MKNIEGKGEIVRNEPFIYFPQYFPFYRIDKLSSELPEAQLLSGN